MSGADRRGSAGFQLAALVELLFVITFLLICEREVLMRRRVKKIQATLTAAKDELKKAEKAMLTARKLFKAAERERKKAEDELKMSSRAVQDLERMITGDKSREKKLEKDLHHVFDWLLDGMRRRDGGVITR